VAKPWGDGLYVMLLLRQGRDAGVGVEVDLFGVSPPDAEMVDKRLEAFNGCGVIVGVGSPWKEDRFSGVRDNGRRLRATGRGRVGLETLALIITSEITLVSCSSKAPP